MGAFFRRLPAQCAPALSLLLLVCLVGLASTSDALAAAPEFRPAEQCPVVNDDLSCGYVRVPENRISPESQPIDLLVYILKSKAEEKQPDPVVFIDGGPGIDSTDFVRSLPSSALRAHRDIIIVMQRGTTGDDRLCPELIVYQRETFFKDTTVETAHAEFLRDIGACFSRLRTGGRDVDGYTNLQNALDFRDVRLALKIDQWNLWGGSYGTAVAQELIRQDPDGIRSAVLDGVVPIDAFWGEGIAENHRRAFSFLSDVCAAQPGCEAEYGDMLALRGRALKALAEKPMILENSAFFFDDEFSMRAAYEKYSLNDHDLSNVVYSLLYDSGSFEIIPLLLKGVIDNEPKIVSPILENILPEAFSPSFDYGAYYAVACRFSLRSGAAFEEYVAANRDLTIGLYSLVFLPEICPTLELAPAAPLSHAKVTTEIPTLFLSGQFDPVTPPEFAERVKEGFSNAVSFEVAGSGHGVSSDGCGELIAADFLKDPTKPIPSSCHHFGPARPIAMNITLSGASAWVSQAWVGEFWSSLLLERIVVIPLLLLMLFIFAEFHGIASAGGNRGQDFLRTMRTSMILYSAVLSIILLGGLILAVTATAQKFPTVVAWGIGFQAPGGGALLWLAPVLMVSAVAGVIWTIADWLRGAASPHQAALHLIAGVSTFTLASFLFYVGLQPNVAPDFWAWLTKVLLLEEFFYLYAP